MTNQPAIDPALLHRCYLALKRLLEFKSGIDFDLSYDPEAMCDAFYEAEDAIEEVDQELLRNPEALTTALHEVEAAIEEAQKQS